MQIVPSDSIQLDVHPAIVAAGSFTLDAPKSNLPPFDIALPVGVDPEEAAHNIVVNKGGIVPAGSFKLDEGSEVVRQAASLAHTARAMGETGAGIATGMIAFPVSKLRGLWEYAITLGDEKAAKAAEEAWAKAIQFEPTTKEAQGAMKTIDIAIAPIFNTLKQMGESTPAGYAGGVATELGGAIALGKAGKIVKGEIKGGIASAKESLRSMEEGLKFGDEPVPPRVRLERGEMPPEIIKADSIVLDKPEVRVAEPVRAEIVPAKSIILDAKAETPPTEIVQPMTTSTEKGATGIKNAQTVAEREARGLSEVEVNIRRSNPVAFDEAKRRIENGEVDPRLFAQELAEKPRSLTPEESAVLIIDRQKIKAEHKAAMDVVEKAIDSKDTIAEAEARVKLKDVEDIYDINDTAARLTGYEQGAGLQARKMMVDEDFSLASMVQRAKVENGGKPISPEMRTKFEALSKQIEETQAKLRAYEEKAASAEATIAVEKLNLDVAKEQRQTKRVYKKEELSTEFSGLVKELNTVLGGQLNAGIDPAGVVILGKMARNRVQSGIISAEGIVDSIYTEVRKMGVEISKRDIRDAISGYGLTSAMSKEEIAVQLREAKHQMRLVSALEDAQAKQVPLRSGLQRDVPSDTVRELQRKVKQTMREQGIDSYSSRTPEQKWKTSLETFKTRTTHRIADLEKKLASGDFSKPGKKATTVLDAEALSLQFKLDKAKQAYYHAAMMDRLANRTIGQRIGGGIVEAMNLSRALKTSFDLSAVLRQGGLLHFGDPRLLANSTRGMFKALKSEKGQFAVEQEMINRPNYPLYKQGGLFLSEHGQKLSQMEENYMSRHAEKIPGVGASQRAYTTDLNVLRADKFDELVATLSKKEKPSPLELEAIGTFVNEFTGRGSLRGKENALVGLNTVFFAPRYVLSRFQVLAGHPLWGGTTRTRILFAKEYAKTLAGISVVIGLGLAAGGTVEVDPRSSDFGKIKIGNTRRDLLAGLSQSTVLMSRLVSGGTKTTKGKVVPIRGDKVPFGTGNSADVIARFLRSKLSPVVSVGVDIASGKDVVGQKVTVGSLPEKLLMPLSFNDIYQRMQEMGIPKENALGVLSIFGMVLDTALSIFGAGMQTYDPKKKQ